MGLAPHTRLAAALLVLPVAGASALLVAGVAHAQSTAAVKAVSASNRFEPASVTVGVGGTVTWTSDGYHTVTGGTDGTEDSSSPIGNNTLADASAKVTITFDKPGTYPYYCIPHVSLGMKGEVVVTPAGGGAAPASPAAQPSAVPSASATAIVATTDPQGSSESARPDDQNLDEEEHSGIPGSTAEDNPTLKEIEDERAADENKLSGFNSLLAAGSLALIALCVAVFASTRPRRPSR